MHVKKGDMVKILSGKDRGRQARVVRVFLDLNRVLVDGINLKKKHRKSRRQDKKGEIVLLPSPLASSVVQVVCPSCGKPARIGFGRGASGEKQRICKRCKHAW